MTERKYCGFVCGDIIDKQNEIINEIYEFSKINKPFALVMLGRITDICYNAAQGLPKLEVTPQSST